MTHAPPVSTWADYRRRSRWFWGLLVLGPFAALAVGAIWLVEHVGLQGLAWPLAAWVAALFLAARHWQSFRCPRCEHHFFAQRPLFLALRAQRCVNCMLSKD